VSPKFGCKGTTEFLLLLLCNVILNTTLLSRNSRKTSLIQVHVAATILTRSQYHVSKASCPKLPTTFQQCTCTATMCCFYILSLTSKTISEQSIWVGDALC